MFWLVHTSSIHTVTQAGHHCSQVDVLTQHTSTTSKPIFGKSVRISPQFLSTSRRMAMQLLVSEKCFMATTKIWIPSLGPSHVVSGPDHYWNLVGPGTKAVTEAERSQQLISWRLPYVVKTRHLKLTPHTADTDNGFTAGDTHTAPQYCYVGVRPTTAVLVTWMTPSAGFWMSWNVLA